MAETPKLLQANRDYAGTFEGGDLEIAPSRPLAVLTCIDARLDPERFLGLGLGDAHVIRNAGGRATDDAIRSLLISSWLLGTREFAVIHHTDCGMTKFTDDVLQGMIKEGTGQDVSDVQFLSFADVEGSVREDVGRLRGLATLPQGVTVSGFVYDVRTGLLSEVPEG